MDSWEPADLDDLEEKPKVAWEEISPESLRRSADVGEIDDGVKPEGVDGKVGMAWFEIILGVFLGLAMAIALWWWSDGGLWVLAPVPGLVLGASLMAFKRRDIKYLGYGLLLSPVVALVLGLAFWYFTLFT